MLLGTTISIPLHFDNKSIFVPIAIYFPNSLQLPPVALQTGRNIYKSQDA